MGGCCKKKCIQDIPIREIKDAREHYWTKNVQERKAMLTGAVKNGLVFKGGLILFVPKPGVRYTGLHKQGISVSNYLIN